MTTPEIERRLHNGRAVVGFTDDEGDVAGWPEVAYEAIRGINHLTLYGGGIPAPTVYDVLGNVKGVGHMLPQALRQLGDGLAASLDEFDVYDNSGRTPGESVDQARAHLEAAAEAARKMGGHLEGAQSAIAAQGYRDFGR